MPGAATVRGIDGLQVADPLRRPQGGQEWSVGAPVMRDQPYPAQAHAVHERQHVGRPDGGVITARRCLRPAESPPVRADQQVVPGQQGG